MNTTPPDMQAAEAGSLADNVRMVLTVILVCAVAAALLGFVHARTREPIERSRRQELVQALELVMPPHDNKPCDTALVIGAPDAGCARTMYTATSGGAVSGHALQTCSNRGFGPVIHLLVGATPQGVVTGVYILAHQETPGLGAKITEEQEQFPRWRRECARDGCIGNQPFLRQFASRRADTFRFQVRKDGGDVDAITASTISSRAVAEAVGEAVRLLQQQAQESRGETP